MARGGKSLTHYTVFVRTVFRRFVGLVRVSLFVVNFGRDVGTIENRVIWLVCVSYMNQRSM